MKTFSTKLFFAFSMLVTLLIFTKVNTTVVKADAAFSNQQGVVIRSANFTTAKVIVVPKKPLNKSNSISYFGSSKSVVITANRGGSGRGNDVIAYAYKFLHTPYVWGASGPNAFDCSGFTRYVFSAFGIQLAHYTGSQYSAGQGVTRGNLSAGDLVFFNTYGPVSHVGIYIGGGDFIHAASSRTGVIISNLNDGYYASHFAGARRVLR